MNLFLKPTKEKIIITLLLTLFINIPFISMGFIGLLLPVLYLPFMLFDKPYRHTTIVGHNVRVYDLAGSYTGLFYNLATAVLFISSFIMWYLICSAIIFLFDKRRMQK